MCPCPPQMPTGFYWYGGNQKSPGRIPKWLQQLMLSLSSNKSTSVSVVNTGDQDGAAILLLSVEASSDVSISSSSVLFHSSSQGMPGWSTLEFSTVELSTVDLSTVDGALNSRSLDSGSLDSGYLLCTYIRIITRPMYLTAQSNDTVQCHYSYKASQAQKYRYMSELTDKSTGILFLHGSSPLSVLLFSMHSFNTLISSLISMLSSSWSLIAFKILSIFC